VRALEDDDAVLAGSLRRVDLQKSAFLKNRVKYFVDARWARATLPTRQFFCRFYRTQSAISIRRSHASLRAIVFVQNLSESQRRSHPAV
jgi:hypothetical protein